MDCYRQAVGIVADGLPFVISEGEKMERFKKRFLAVLIIITAICIILAAVTGREYATEASENSSAYMDELLQYTDWKLVGNDGRLLDLELPAQIPLTKAQNVKLLNLLPKTLNNGTYLAFESYSTYVTVRADGEIIYQNLDNNGKRAVTMWNLVPLESKLAQGRITIEFSGKDLYDLSILPKIYMGPKSEVLALAEAQRFPNMMISMSVIILGLLVFLFSAVTFTNRRFVQDFIVLGSFIMILGISQLWQITSPTDSLRIMYIQQCIAVSSFGLLPALYCYYRGIRTEGKTSPLYAVTAYGYLGFFAVVFLWHWFLPVPAWSSMRTVIYLSMELTYGFCLFCTVFKETSGNRQYRLIISLSILVLMTCIGAEGFTYMAYISGLSVKPMVLGSLIFSLLQIVAVVFSTYDYIEQQMRMANELNESRVKIMVNQMRPHFIRSALGAIRSVIKSDPDKAYDLLYDFTNYLSFNIETMDNLDPIPFRDELRHIREYAAIEQERFYPRVRVEYEIETEDFRVPPLSIQPFVENAIRHGILAKREGGLVRVITEETDNTFIVTVADNGGGFDVNNPPPAPPSHGISAKNASYRLESTVGASVDTQSEPGKGAIVTVTIPKERSAE